MNDAEEESRVREFLRKEVEWWDDHDGIKGVVMFKGFNGQRCDWEARYLFWRDLIIKVARHLRTFIIRPSRLSNVWFRRGPSFSPLCLHQVLVEMYNAGDLIRVTDLVESKTGPLSLIFWRSLQMLGFSRPSFPDNFSEDSYILSELLKERACEVVNVLSNTHWTSSCIITLKKFKQLCGGSNEASALLKYLSSCGKAKILAVDKKDFIEGVKISLTHSAIADVTKLDCDVLHLIWTAEKLEEQIDLIDQRCERYRSSAAASVKSGQKQVALRHLREMRSASQSRERCTLLLNRVVEVIHVITDAESSRKVVEAIKAGAQAIKANRMSVEDIEQCLTELDLSVNSLKEVDELLGSTPESAIIADEDLECELKQIELEIKGESVEVHSSEVGQDCEMGVVETLETAESLCNTLSNLVIAASPATKEVRKHVREATNPVSTNVNFECA